MAVPTPRTVNVYGSDLETQPLAVFETPITVDEIRKTLGLAKGGLKRKSGPEIYTNNLNAGGDFTFIGGPKFIISVTFMGTTAMLNVKSPKSKVRALIAEIAAHFSSLVSGDPDETKIAELRSGGVLMNLNEVIDNVLTDGSSVEAVDFKTWSTAILKNCDDEKLKVLQSELDESFPDKWAKVGFVKGTPKVFIKLGHGYQKNIKVYKLELLDADSLQHYPKDGRHLIAYVDGTTTGGKYVMEAHVRVAGGIAVAIELSVKASTTKKPAIREIAVKVVNNQIEFGDATTIQSDNPVVDKKYVLPAAKATGPNLNAEVAADAKLKEKKQKEAPAQSFAAGAMQLNATCKGVYAEQRTGRGDEWFQCYYFAMEFKNPEDQITVANTRIEYQNAAGEWVAANNDNVHCGRWSGGWRFDWDWRGSTGGKFYIGGKDVTENALRAAFGMPKSIPCGERRRTHRALPQPLKMRLTFNTVDGKSGVLDITQVNDEPLDLPTKASREKDKYSGKELVKFICADDTSAETRTFVEQGQVETSNDWSYVPITWNDSSKYVYLSDLRKWAYQGMKEGKSEVLVTDIKHESGTNKIVCTGLIDSQLGSVYALRFDITTSTSSTTDYVLIPHLTTPYD